MRITALVIEERAGSSGMLVTYLNSLLDEITVLATAAGMEAGEQAIRQHQPDVVFVSRSLVERRIQLGGARGVLLTQDWWSQDQLVGSGIHAQLLLPTSLDEIRSMLDRFRQESKRQTKVEAGNFHLIPDTWRRIQEQMASIPVVKGFRMVHLQEICLITSAGSYADVHLQSGEKFQASRSLKYLAAQMEPLGFFRCHDSFVVNLMEILQYSKGRGGTLRMRNGEEIPVSRYRREPLMELLHPGIPSSSASIPTDN